MSLSLLLTVILFQKCFAISGSHNSNPCLVTKRTGLLLLLLGAFNPCALQGKRLALVRKKYVQ